jgi:hypothetical protein
MITAKHVREEVDATGKVIADPKASVSDKLSAVYKLLTVVLKVDMSIRTNTKLIMDKTGAKPLPPRKRSESSLEKEKAE